MGERLPTRSPAVGVVVEAGGGIRIAKVAGTPELQYSLALEEKVGVRIDRR